MITERSAVALGFFDGVHIAHQKIIEAAVSYAKEKSLSPLALTFEKAPFEVLSSSSPGYITTNEEKERLIKNSGAKTLFLKTDSSFLSMEPEKFILDVLLKEYNMLYAVCGYNYTFGKSGKGNTDMLLSYGKKYGFEVNVIDKVTINGDSVSSSRIRELLNEGKIKEANLLLGRNFSVTGMVSEGKHLGRELGFPTANVFFEKNCVRLKNGVYKTRVFFDGKYFDAITNVGTNPTVGGENLRTETFIPSFNENLYGKKIILEFLDFLRSEKKFDSIESLKTQIKKDLEKITN